MPAITSIAITIGGSAVSLGDIVLNEIELFNRDETRRMTFTRDSVLPEDDSWINSDIRITINGDTVFIGKIRSREPVFADDTGWLYAYTAYGQEFLGDDWPIVSPFDGTGSVSFNRATTDAGYDPTYDGMSLGEMILAVLQEPTTRDYLKSNGIGRFNADGEIDPRTVSDLSEGFMDSYRPSDPVTFAGDQLFQAIRGVMQSAAPNYRLWFEPVTEPPPDDPEGPEESYLIIRFADLRETAATKSIDLATAPAPQLRRDYSNSFSRVIVRGGPDIRPVILDMEDGDLSEFFEMPPWIATNTIAKQQWNIDVWYGTERKEIKGTCLCRRPRTAEEADPGDPQYIEDPEDELLADPGWLLVDPADNTLTWAENAYNQSSSGLAGFLYIERNEVAEWMEVINRKVVYNTALTAGGKSYLQLDNLLPNIDYAKFTMIPGIQPGTLTWRRYKIERKTADDKSIAKYAQPAFPVPIPWEHTDGTALSFTQAAIATIYCTPTGEAEERKTSCSLSIDRKNEAIILALPSVTFFGQPQSLQTGGVDVDGQPDNIRVFLPVALKPLEIIEPPNDEEGNPVFSGTCFTIDGIERTHYVNLPDWVSELDTGPIRLWARQILDGIKDTIVDGSAIVYDFDPVYRPGVAIEFVDSCYEVSPYASYTSQIYSCLVRFNHGGAIPYHTEYAVSNRRDQYRGSNPSTHPIVMAPMKANKENHFKAGALISRGRDEIAGGNTRSIREFAITKLDPGQK